MVEDKNQASNCEGGKNTPFSIIAQKNLANFAVSEV